jgi:hypothetical protein
MCRSDFSSLKRYTTYKIAANFTVIWKPPKFFRIFQMLVKISEEKTYSAILLHFSAANQNYINQNHSKTQPIAIPIKLHTNNNHHKMICT